MWWLALIWTAAAGRPLPVLTVEEQLADLEQVRTGLLRDHPGATAYATPADIDARFDEVRASLHEGSVVDEMGALLRFVEVIGCGHTTIGWGRNRRRVARQDGWFPFDLVPVGDRWFVDPRTHPGPVRELLRIDGIPIRNVMDEVAKAIPSDGGSRQTKRFHVDQNAALYLGVTRGLQEQYDLSEFMVQGVKKRDVPSLQAPPQRSWVRPEPGVVVIRLDGFDNSDLFTGFVEEVQAELNTATSAIVDLRSNPGGSGHAMLGVWSLFASEPLDVYADLAVTPSAGVFDGFMADEDGLLHPGPDQRDFWLVRGFEPSPTAFRGSVQVLVSAQTSSAASHLAWLLQEERGATVVGHETGGGAALMSAGVFAPEVLQESGLELFVPRMMFVLGPGPRGRGVVPDIEILPTIEDLAAGRDPVLDEAIGRASDQGRSSP